MGLLWLLLGFVFHTFAKDTTKLRPFLQVFVSLVSFLSLWKVVCVCVRASLCLSLSLCGPQYPNPPQQICEVILIPQQSTIQWAPQQISATQKLLLITQCHIAAFLLQIPLRRELLCCIFFLFNLSLSLSLSLSKMRNKNKRQTAKKTIPLFCSLSKMGFFLDKF